LKDIIMVTTDFATAIAADLKATNPPLADLFVVDPVVLATGVDPVITPVDASAPAPGTIIAFIEQIVSYLMTLFGGCGIAPVAATAMMVGRPGLRGMFDRSNLISAVMKNIHGSELQAALVIPVVNSMMKIGKTVTLDKTTAMMSEAGVAVMAA
jgi:hypothetical protein